jgi:hypothetical protein
MKLKGNFDIQEEGGKLFLVRKKEDDGKCVRLGMVSESLAWLFEQLKGKEFDVQDISKLLQSRYEVQAEQADAESILLTVNWRRSRMLEGDFGSAEKVKQAMLFLLKGALWGKANLPKDVFPLTIQEWISVYIMAGMQAVIGTAFDGLSILPKELLPPPVLMTFWRKSVSQTERTNMLADAAIYNLQKFFADGGLPVMVLKGQGVGSFYRQPFYRQCGDIDLYFGSMEAAEKAADFAESKGMKVSRGMDNDSNFGFQGIFIEIHSRIVEQHNFFTHKYLRRLETDAFKKGQTVTRDKVSFLIPPAAMNHLLQSTHILKHLLNEGIGLRQLCDAAISLHTLKNQTDTEELVRIMKHCDVYRWSKLLYALLVKYLDLPAEDLPMETHENPDALMEEIWTTGNFGVMDERWGSRPEGEWKGRMHTARRIFNKMWRFGKYAKVEVVSWALQLSFGSVFRPRK